MKRCVIFAALPVSAALHKWWDTADFVIAADAGYESARALGVKADLLLGDYDSAPAPDLDGHTVKLPAEKDDTDTYYAVRKALEIGFEEIVILGGIGGRFDHTMANLQTLVLLAQRGVRGILADETTEITALLPGTYEIPRRDNVYLSLFTAEKQTEGVSLRGLKYSLTNYTMTNSFPIGVSNEFEEEKATISFRKGSLYLMFCQK
ncbi:thiamine diphosphokinase [uncultured Ruthenibacterium sp.]|uniref:thiamine diphosphokinase n=1 Tax=uncultured Ruthenibacterium sp. TaxID=1905347 RepID=UPI00349ED861